MAAARPRRAGSGGPGPERAALAVGGGAGRPAVQVMIGQGSGAARADWREKAVSLPELTPRSGGPASSSRSCCVHARAAPGWLRAGRCRCRRRPGTAGPCRGRQAAPVRRRGAPPPLRTVPARGRRGRGDPEGAFPRVPSQVRPPATPPATRPHLVSSPRLFPRATAGRTSPSAPRWLCCNAAEQLELAAPGAARARASRARCGSTGRRRDACTEEDAAAACPQHGPASAQPAQPSQRCCRELAAAAPL
ncbi:uncharacterized protein C10orf95 [Ammospiza nelsoni]|uniref:uncharacterized protein C10orf95 n=1 Tax=Ammospiza nelsoni TaxID=2857394 RepID=UPI00286C2CB9|nr:uncharacterized protein C10orf95 [Ammospiza nelsoni]